MFDLLVRPLIARLHGGDPPGALSARLTGAAFRRNWRTQAMPARLSTDLDGTLCAEIEAARPSGDPFGLLHGDGYAVVPAEAEPDATPRVPIILCSSGWGEPR